MKGIHDQDYTSSLRDPVARCCIYCSTDRQEARTEDVELWPWDRYTVVLIKESL